MMAHTTSVPQSWWVDHDDSHQGWEGMFTVEYLLPLLNLRVETTRYTLVGHRLQQVELAFSKLLFSMGDSSNN